MRKQMNKMIHAMMVLALVVVAGSMTACKTSEVGKIVEAGMVAAGQSPEEAAKYSRIATNVSGALAPVDEETELSLGGGVAVEAYSQVGPRNSHEALQKYVNLVGRVVAANSGRPGLPYSFAVLMSDTPNAFAGPGGYIFISSGALKLMESEAELAGVLAHEVAHVTQKHMLQTYQRANVMDAAQKTASEFDNDVAGYSKMIDMTTDTLFNKGLDQKFEYEADVVGLEIAVMSGYDPNGLVMFLKKLAKVTNHQGGWMKTHPPLNERIRRLQSIIATEFRGEKGQILRPRFQQAVRPYLQ